MSNKPNDNKGKSKIKDGAITIKTNKKLPKAITRRIIVDGGSLD